MKGFVSKMLMSCAFFLTACSDGQEALAETTQIVSDGQKGTVVRDLTIQSTVLGREMKFSVYLPAGYTESKQYPVLYLLHGNGGDQNEWWVYDDLADDADAMIASDEVPEMIVVTPDGLTSMYMDKRYGTGIDYETYFFEEFLPYVESRYSIRRDRQSRAVGGFSMGGYGALRFGVMHHELFCYVYAMSACIGGYGAPDMGDIIPGYQPSLLPGITLECGTNDFFTYDNREFSALLTQLGIAHEHIERQGNHDWVFWSACTPKMLRKVGSLFSQSVTGYYTRQSLISDVISDPDFEGFGRLLFPADDGYWSGTTLENLRLTWYTGIDPDKTVEIVNKLKSDAASGQTVFIDIYTEAEKLADPEKRNTGLFFFRAVDADLQSASAESGISNPLQRKPFAICNAGGGHVFVGAMHDSFPHALEISKQGLNAFALIYRPDWGPSDEDLARALTYIYDHADELGVSREGYSLWGGSAGARMAADMSRLSHMRSSTGRTDIPQAAACIMQYTGSTTVAADYAPTYACCGTSDGIASWRTMQSRLDELSTLGISTEFHAYNGLPHGFGLGTGTVAEGWINDAIRFWNQQHSGSTRINQTRTSDGSKPQAIYSLNGTRRDTIKRGVNIVDGKAYLVK